MIEVWVLVWAFWSRDAIAIPGIISEQECYALRDRMEPRPFLRAMGKCYSYKTRVTP